MASFEDWAIDQFCLNEYWQRFLFGGSIHITNGIYMDEYGKPRQLLWHKELSLAARVQQFWRLDQSYRFPYGLKWAARTMRTIFNLTNFSLQVSRINNICKSC